MLNANSLNYPFILSKGREEKNDEMNDNGTVRCTKYWLYFVICSI